MSHQTGIQASDLLLSQFAEAKNEGSRERVLKVVIDTSTDPEQLVDGGSECVSGSWQDDFSKVGTLLKDKEACYIFYKFDRKAEDPITKWLFVCYIPDNAPVRSKMLYASTKTTVRTQFGGKQFIADEVAATNKSELTYDGYLDHVEHKAAPVPLSLDELEKERMDKESLRPDVSIDSKHQTLQGIAFPLSRDALDALTSLRDGRVTFVQLSLDINNETIELAASETIDVNGLSGSIPKGESRYSFFCFKHQYEGDYKEDVVFIYSMGGYSSSIKQRMLYSSCKSPCLSVVEDQLGIPLVKKIEIDSTEEVTEEYLMDAVHPIRNVHRPKFDKPKGPGNRAGPRRLIKGSDK